MSRNLSTPPLVQFMMQFPEMRILFADMNFRHLSVQPLVFRFSFQIKLMEIVFGFVTWKYVTLKLSLVFSL